MLPVVVNYLDPGALRPRRWFGRCGRQGNLSEADVPDPNEGSGDSASDQLIDRHELRSAPADIGGKDFRLSLSDGPHCGCAAG